MKAQVCFIITLALFLAGCSKGSPSGKKDENAPAVALVLSTDSETVVAGFCSKENVVKSVDIYGNPANVAIEQIIRVSSSSPSVSFFSDENCTIRVTSVKIPVGSNSSRFFFKASNAEYLTITSSTQNLSADVQSKTIVSPFASNIKLSGQDVLTAGACSNEMTVTSLNYKDEESVTDTNLSISIFGNGSGKFYESSDCSGTPVTSLQIPIGQSKAKFYFKTTKSGPYNFSATMPGPITAKMSRTVSPNIPSKFSFATAPQYVEAGICSAQVIVKVQDEFGNVVKVSNDSVVNLISPDTLFYADSFCSSDKQISNTLVPANSDTFNFFIKSNKIGESEIEVSGFASQKQTVNVSPARPVKLALSNLPSSIIAGNSFEKISVTIEDSFGNTSLGTNQLVSISAYADSNCTILAGKTLNGFTQVTSSSGVANYIAISYNKAENIYIGARSGSLLPSCSSKITVISDFPSQLTIDGPSSVVAGVCSEFNLISTDKHGNHSAVDRTTSVALSGEKSGKFYSSQDCADAGISSVSFSAGNVSKKIYYKNTKVEQIIFSFAGIGNSASTRNVVMSSGAPSKIVALGPQNIIAGQCLSGYQVKSQDIFGNDSSVPDDFPVSIEHNGSQGGFFSDATCTSRVDNFAIAKGSSGRNLFYKNKLAESSGINFIGTASFVSSLTIKTAPSSPVKLGISIPSSIPVGAFLSSLRVDALDENNNVADYSKIATISAHTDSTCSSSPLTLSGTTTKALILGSASFDDVRQTKKGLVYFKARGESVNDSCSSAVNFTSDNPSRTKIIISTSANAGECIPASVISSDSFANEIPVSSDEIISLIAEKGDFYSAGDCVNKLTSVTIPSGSSKKSVFFKSTKSGTFNVKSFSASLSEDPSQIKISPLTPSKIAFVGPSQIDASVCSPALDVTAQDIYSNATMIATEARVVLAQSGDGSFYADEQCNSEISNIKINADSSSSKVYYKSNKAETVTLAGTAPNFNTETYSLVVGSLPPSRLLVSGPKVLYSGECSGPIKITAVDVFENISKAREDLPIDISGFGSGHFYSSSDCSGAELNEAVLSTNDSSINLYYRNNKAEQIDAIFTLNSNPSLFDFTVFAAAPGKVEITSDPKTIQAGVCSGTTVAQVKDLYGNNTRTNTPVTVSLSGNFLKFYSEQGCSGPEINSIVIPENGETHSFFVYTTNIDSTSINVTAYGKEFAQPLIVTPGPAVKLGFKKLPASGTTGVVSFSNPIAASVQDQYGNTVPSDVDALGDEIEITVAPYVNSECSVLSGTIFTGENKKFVSAGVATYPDIGYTSASTIYILATSPGFPPACSSSVTVHPQAPSKIAISGPPSAIAGSCAGPFSITTKDIYNNTSNALSATQINVSGLGPNGNIYSTSDCSGTPLSTSLTISQNSHTVSFYYKETVARSYMVLAESGLGNSTYPFAIQASSPSKVIISGPTDVIVNKCSPSFSVKTQDSFNNNSDLSTEQTFSLQGKASGNFYSDPSCSTIISTVSVPSGQYEGKFYYKNSVVNESTVFSTTIPNFTTISASVLVIPPPPVKLLISGANTIVSSECNPYLVILKDVDNEDATSTGNTFISLSGNGTAVFHTNSSCSSPTTTATVSDGTTSKMFWIRATKAETITITTSNPSLTSASKLISVAPGPVSAIDFKVQPTLTIKAGEQFQNSLEAQFVDASGNKVFVDDGTEILLTLEDENGPSSGLIGISSVAPDRNTGISLFAGISITKSGSYKLAASGASIKSYSNSFTVSPNSPALVEKVSGDNQVAFVGTTFDSPLVIKLLDSYGNIIPGTQMSWSSSGSGSFNPSTSITGNDGLTQTVLTAGSQQSQNISITAAVSSVPTIKAVFSVSYNAHCSNLQTVSGNGKCIDKDISNPEIRITNHALVNSIKYTNNNNLSLSTGTTQYFEKVFVFNSSQECLDHSSNNCSKNPNHPNCLSIQSSDYSSSSFSYVASGNATTSNNSIFAYYMNGTKKSACVTDSYRIDNIAPTMSAVLFLDETDKTGQVPKVIISQLSDNTGGSGIYRLEIGVGTADKSDNLSPFSPIPTNSTEYSASISNGDLPSDFTLIEGQTYYLTLKSSDQINNITILSFPFTYSKPNAMGEVVAIHLPEAQSSKIYALNLSSKTKTLLLDSDSPFYFGYTHFNDKLYFTAFKGNLSAGVREELWSYDGVSQPVLVASGIKSQNLYKFKDKLFFTKQSESNGVELFYVDLTGNVGFFDLNPGAADSYGISIVIPSNNKNVLMFGSNSNIYSYSGSGAPSLMTGILENSSHTLSQVAFYFQNRTFYSGRSSSGTVMTPRITNNLSGLSKTFTSDYGLASDYFSSSSFSFQAMAEINSSLYLFGNGSIYKINSSNSFSSIGTGSGVYSDPLSFSSVILAKRSSFDYLIKSDNSGVSVFSIFSGTDNKNVYTYNNFVFQLKTTSLNSLYFGSLSSGNTFPFNVVKYNSDTGTFSTFSIP